MQGAPERPEGAIVKSLLALTLLWLGLAAAAVAQPLVTGPELILVLADTTRAPQAMEVVDDVNAQRPLSGRLGLGQPQRARFVLPYRATGETLALLEADPDSPRARIERAIVLTYPLGTEVEKLGAELSADPQILEVGENDRFDAAVVPNDPMFAVNPNPLQYQWGPHLLNLPAAWDRIKGNAYLGAVETGIQSSHPDLQAFTSGGGYRGGSYRPHLSWDFAGGDNNADELQGGLGVLGTSAAGHGTHVSGILAATSNNTSGVAGTCWGCSVLIGRNNMSTAQVIAAMTWLVDHGVQVINASLGRSSQHVDPCNPPVGFQPDPLCQALNFAEQRGVLVVAASGNARKDINFPASDARAVAVGGIRFDGAFWDDGCFVDNCGSNYTLTPGRKQQDVVAPAKDVLSTVYLGRNWITVSPFCGEGSLVDGYGLCTGTSMSTPFVTGIAGLLRSANPLLGRADIRRLLVENASRSNAWDPRLGYGIPNAAAAVSKAMGTVRGQVLANRLTPLFSLYSATARDHLYTVFPQVAAAALFGLVSETCARSLPNDLNCRFSIPYQSVGASVPGYPQFPGFPSCNAATCPAAAVYLFTSQTPPYAGAPPLVPLYRLSYNPARTSSTTTDTNRDITYTTETPGLTGFRSVGYELDGIEGYIYQRCTPEPGCIPAGAVRLYRLYHPGRDDYAIFPESELPQKSAEGYTSTPGLNDWIGYVYPKVDRDGDTVIDGFETLVGTNTLRADSDCDGRSDGLEMLQFPYSDPLGGPGCP
jgi:serine protease